ncbi:MAG: hypothetical protein ACP5D2_02680 [Candidatus Nanoarchaeia archaeon]
MLTLEQARRDLEQVGLEGDIVKPISILRERLRDKKELGASLYSSPKAGRLLPNSVYQELQRYFQADIGLDEMDGFLGHAEFMYRLALN